MEQSDVEDPMTECEICTEAKTSTEIFTNDDACAHPFCKDCVANYITVKVQVSGDAIVPCPAVNCGQSLDIAACRPIIPAHLFERWSFLLCRTAVQEPDGCYCPNNLCSELIVNECGGPVQGWSACPNCKEVFCFRCRIAWQEGHRCWSRRRRTTGDRLFEHLAARMKWARCPLCHHYVELAGGCPKTKCRCGTLFCYYCGKSGLCRCKYSAGEARYSAVFYLVVVVVGCIICHSLYMVLNTFGK